MPSGDQAGSVSDVRPSVRRLAVAGRDVDEPQVLDPVVGEARAVEHVVEAVDEPVVGRRRRAGLGGDRGRAGAGRRAWVAPCDALTTTSRVPSGDHSNAVDAARQVGQPARLAAVERQEVDLVASSRSLPSGAWPAISSSSRRLPVREERERPAIGREARMPVVPGAEGQLARRSRAVGRDEPERAAVAVEARGDRLERDDRHAAVGRQARLGRDAEAVQVVGAGGARHGVPPQIGTWAV